MTDRWSVEQRDRYQIHQAICRYIWGTDRRDAELRMSAFAPGGRMLMNGVELFGPNAVDIAKMPLPAGAPTADQLLASSHHIHQSDIQLRGDEAFCETNFTAQLLVDRGQGREMLVRGVRAHDHFIRVGDDWGILERVSHVDWMFEVPASMGTPFVDRAAFADFISAKTATAGGGV